MSLVPNRALEGAAGNQGYNLQRSLRFRSSASAYLSRTFGTPTAATTWTLSCWVKRGALGTAQSIMDANTSGIYFDSGDHICLKNNGANTATSTAVYRDPSAWYHILVKSNGTQSEVYINNSSSTVAYWLGTLSNFNTAIAHNFGRSTDATRYSDCYYAEVNFIDGQALTPSSFGETDSTTGVWKPKKYTGTYGTNGFYLPFTDNTSATTLAYDKSGNGNNWTPNNISTTAGATYDSMTDVPTLTSATAANFCTLNPIGYGYQFSSSYASSPSLATGATLTQGNLYARGANAGTGYYGSWVGTMPLDNGKWYWEITLTAEPTADFSFPGIVRYDNGTTNAPYLASNGSYTLNDVLGFTWDDTAKELKWYKNNTLQTTIVTGATGSYLPFVGLANANEMAFNFGQRPFSYTPPTGFKALNTFNLPDPTIKKPNQYMDATLWTGDGTTPRAITNAAGFQPDFVWYKKRSGIFDHNLFDAIRGAGQLLESDTTAAESTQTQRLLSFNSNGFSVGNNSGVNNTGDTYVGWQWKESATAGFDIVTYTGNGTAGTTIAHNLGVAPKMIIVKSRSIVSPNYGWQVQHTSLGATKSLVLNSTSAALTSTGFWNDTAPTSSVFTVGNDWDVNKSTVTYVAYLFAEIAGFSKFGSYTGNGSADGPFVYCGFRPKYVLWKNTSTGGDGWYIYDSVRQTYNAMTTYLSPTFSVAEGTNGGAMDILSNGFKLRNTGTDMNTNGNTYIYAAFSENPFKYSLAR